MEDELWSTEDKVTDVPRELLYDRVQQLKYSGAALQTENELFERFIGLMVPEDQLSQTGAEGPGPSGASQSDGGGGGRRRKSRPHTDPLPQLTLEQKLYVAQTLVTETQGDQERLKLRCGRIQDNHKATMEEAELRLADIKKAQKEFERRLLKPLRDNRLDMRDSDKALQYIQDRSQVTQSEKYTVKNQALKVQEKKLQQQLQQIKETGKAEYEEIFQEYDEQKINKSLEELQVNHLKVQRVLSSHKEKLQSVTLESTELSDDIIKRRQMLAKLEEEIQHAEEERLQAEAVNQQLRRQISDYRAPDVTEYIHVKDRHRKLQQSVHVWERKVAIAEMALKTLGRAGSTQKTTLAPVNSADPGSGQQAVALKLPHIAEHCT